MSLVTSKVIPLLELELEDDEEELEELLELVDVELLELEDEEALVEVEVELLELVLVDVEDALAAGSKMMFSVQSNPESENVIKTRSSMGFEKTFIILLGISSRPRPFYHWGWSIFIR